MVRLSGRAHYISAAYWAVLGHLELFVSARMVFVFDHLYDFRDHVAATLDFHAVADLHAEAPDLIHVAQCGAGNGRAADRDRLEPRDRRHLPRASALGGAAFRLGHAP